ncbi:metal ABC transporter solute-binding protein, Zn/Mn family [Sulfurospirillum barnesii]|uniref:ABC-type metal ion transport system, periplasmic component/surface adhesin n=1 Tax=Sulfurospirillum barnesii (strain ATCC 700032 / DSM 10660 / SES-3) TaxID=760154 RepID=I3XU52_SULBS|nr:zinc ABC transporter substrate-binding protein [Sulfurospirillum barnesii]AFL67476.1 ABC-type metal ion transport system, periplasmic component/surface adhesin [Sulfurospirillum barnesii SES-3]
MKRLLLLLTLLLSTLVYAKPTVTVSILPQKYFVDQIAKDLLHVNVMVSPGASPHTYEPKPSQMKELANSDAYFSIGDGFEKVWLPKFKSTHPKLVMVDTIKGIEKIAMAEHHHEEEKGHKGEKHSHAHEHGTLDPHVWLDPILVKMQANTIYEALLQLYPEHKSAFTHNYDAFVASLDTLDATIQSKLSNVSNRKFIIFHPSFGYFAKRYNLEQIAIEVSGKEPKPKELAAIIEEAKEEDAKVVFVSPQFSQKSAQTIATQINGKILTINPLAYEWADNMLNVATIFQSELK